MKVSEYLMTELEYNKLYQQEKDLREKRLKYEKLCAEVKSLQESLRFLSKEHDVYDLQFRIDNSRTYYSFPYINYDDVKDILIKKTQEQLAKTVRELNDL